ncbi:MAG: hypothetical protein U0804_16090 [Gemmataceae bacterium]
MKSCQTCGALFPPTGWNHRFCSTACRPSKLAAYPDGRRPCATCGAAFTRTISAQRFCSPACRPSEADGYKHRKYVERVGGPPKQRGAKPDLAKRSQVRAMRESGLKLAAIAAKMGVTPQAVCLLLAKMRSEEQGAT